MDRYQNGLEKGMRSSPEYQKKCNTPQKAKIHEFIKETNTAASNEVSVNNTETQSTPTPSPPVTTQSTQTPHTFMQTRLMFAILIQITPQGIPIPFLPRLSLMVTPTLFHILNITTPFINICSAPVVLLLMETLMVDLVDPMLLYIMKLSFCDKQKTCIERFITMTTFGNLLQQWYRTFYR
jgi:hypothetical protein